MAQVHSTPVRVDSEGYTVTIIVGAGGAGIYYGSSSDPATLVSSGTFAAAGSTFLLTGPAWVVSAVAGQSADLQLITASTLPSAASTVTATAAQNLAGGRPLVADRLAGIGASRLLASAQTSRIMHTITSDCSDLRFIYGNPFTVELATLVGSYVKLGVEVAGTIYPVTFAGRTLGYFDPNGYVVSDPLPLDFAKGDVIYTRPYIATPWGPTIPLAASIIAGALSFSIASLPSYLFMQALQFAPQPITLDTTGAETVTVTSITGTGPYTVNLQTGTANAHSSGALAGQSGTYNFNAMSDKGDLLTAANGGTVDLAYSGTVGTLANLNYTLTAAASIGDQFVLATGAPQGDTLTLEPGGGNQEVVGITQVLGTASPFRVVLAAPLTIAHASGVQVRGNVAVGSAHAPLAIVADRVKSQTARAKSLIATGDSLMYGNGFNTRQSPYSYVALAVTTKNPHINVAKAGEQLTGFLPYSASRYRRTPLPLADWALMEYGTNDLNSGRTLAQFQADCVTYWTQLKNKGLKVAATTLTPRTNTTDAWATTGNQTSQSGTYDTAKVAYNGWLRDGAPILNGAAVAAGSNAAGTLRVGASGHPLDTYLEFADAVESARDSNKWKATGNQNGAYTVDGTHPTLAGHTALAGVITAAVTAGTFLS